MTEPTLDIPNPNSSSPVAVLAAALRLRDGLRYEEMVSLCDPASLEEWFRAHCAGLRPPTKEELRARFPGGNEAALDRQFAGLQSRADKGMPGMTSYAEILTLTPAEFARRWWEHDDSRFQLTERLRRRGGPDLQWGSIDIEYSFATPTHLREDIVRVAYWTGTEADSELDSAQVDSEDLRRNAAGEWRLIARHDLLRSPISASIIELPQEYIDLLSEDEPDQHETA